MRVLFAVALLWGAPAAAAVLTADGPAKTSGGAAFIAPKSWDLTQDPSGVKLVAPEGDLQFRLVEVDGADAGAAAAAAWRRADPAFARTLKVRTPQPAREGWEERWLFRYVTAPNEKRIAAALLSRKGAGWTALLVDGSEATFQKRSAALWTLLDSLRPPGYVRESFAGRTARTLSPADIASLRGFLAEGMKQLGVPGIGWAVSQDGRVLFEGGQGVRELGKPAPVTEATKFMIASNTKNMTTLLTAKLIDEGKLSWDDRVVDRYPQFRLGDDRTTNSVRVRHLVCACTGLPRKDFAWLMDWNASTPASEVFTTLATTTPTSGFGEVYQYSNLLAAAAGFVAGHVAYPDMEVGAAYDRAMRDRVFEPLGLRDTTLDFTQAQRGDWAAPHADDLSGTPRVGQMGGNESVIAMRPTGGAWSSARDMIRYVQNEIDEGAPGGKRLFGRDNLLERRKPGVREGEDGYYGLGLTTQSGWGVPVVHHGGSMLGYKSDMLFFPKARVGAVILTNSDNGRALLLPFMRRIAELLYDGQPEAVDDVAKAAQALRAQQAAERARLTVPADPARTARLASRYTQPEVGSLAVLRRGADTVFDFGVWRSAVATRQNEDGTTSFITTDPGLEGLEFVARPGGAKDALILREEQHEYIYQPAG